MVALGFAGQALYVDRKAGVVIVTLSCQPQPPYAASMNVDLKVEQHLFKDAVLAEVRVMSCVGWAAERAHQGTV